MKFWLRKNQNVMPVITRRKEQCPRPSLTGQGLGSAVLRLVRRTTTYAARGVAQAKKRSSSSDGLRKWFSRNKGKGWVNCKTGGPCGRKSKKSEGSYPACRPTMAQCKTEKDKAANRKKTSA